MGNFIEYDVLSHVNNFVILVNLEDKIIFVNSMFEKLIDPETKLIGQGIDFFTSHLGIEVSRKSLNDVRKNSPLIDIEHTYKKDDEVELHLLWSFLPRVNNNSTEGIVIIGRDITELKKLSFQVERLDNIIKYAPDWIYWKNKDLVYLGCNERFAKAAGYSSPEDIIGKTDRELVWHKYAHKYNFDDKEVIKTGAPKFGNEDLVPLGDGSQAIVISNKVPLRDHNGETIGILGISTDITEQKKTEEALLHAKAAAEELERLDNIIKYAPDWIYWKDRNSIYLGCNDQLATAAGYSSRNDMIGKSDFDLPWGEHAEKYHLDDREVIESGRPKLNIEEEVITQGGKKTITITNKVPLRGIKGEIIGVLGIATDITNRIISEKSLIKAREAAEQANALKTSFIQNMQHDIRTPISSMWAVLEDLVMHHQAPDHELLTLLRDGAKQLHLICSEVIDFDRIESGDRPILAKKIAIRELVSMVFELNQIAAYDKGLNLTWTVDEKVPEVVKGDEHRVSRILINLIGNALKFTPNGTISLYARLIQEREKDYIIQFKLQDTGIGIPVEKQTTLYEKFNRLTPSNRGLYPGSGLGLRIVKKYVEELSGEISVDSEADRGTTFYIDLPFEKALVATIYKSSSNDPAPRIEVGQNAIQSKIAHGTSHDISTAKDKYTVLFIEDNPAAMKVGTFFLRSMNHAVTEAVNVKSALKALNETKFDFVISDIGLPDGTGFDVIKGAKKDATMLNFLTPFFALTANADQETISQAEKDGFLHVMIKPMQKELIKFLLDQYIVRKENSLLQSTATLPQQLIGLGLPNKEEVLFKLEQYPLLDITEGLTLLGNKFTLRTILSDLVADIPQNITELQQAHSDKNWLLVEKLAHKAKGGAAYVGTIRMKYACQYLECYHKAGYSELLGKLYQQLIEVLDETRSEVISWLKNEPN